MLRFRNAQLAVGIRFAMVVALIAICTSTYAQSRRQGRRSYRPPQPTAEQSVLRNADAQSQASTAEATMPTDPAAAPQANRIPIRTDDRTDNYLLPSVDQLLQANSPSPAAASSQPLADDLPKAADDPGQLSRFRLISPATTCPHLVIPIHCELSVDSAEQLADCESAAPAAEVCTEEPPILTPEALANHLDLTDSDFAVDPAIDSTGDASNQSAESKSPQTAESSEPRILTFDALAAELDQANSAMDNGETGTDPAGIAAQPLPAADDTGLPSTAVTATDDTEQPLFADLSRFRVQRSIPTTPIDMSNEFGDNVARAARTALPWRQDQEPAPSAAEDDAAAQQEEQERESQLLTRMRQPLPNNPLDGLHVIPSLDQQLVEPERFTDRYYGRYEQSAQMEVGGPRQLSYVQWSPQWYAWAAPNFCHRPLYYEDANLERYGINTGLCQPCRSAAHFFVSTALLPLQIGGDHPCRCYYALGYYRPGSCNPALVSHFPITPRGLIYQSLATAGGVFILP